MHVQVDKLLYAKKRSATCRQGAGKAHHFDDITGSHIADVIGKVLDTVPQSIYNGLPLPRNSHARQILRLSITCATVRKPN